MNTYVPAATDTVHSVVDEPLQRRVLPPVLYTVVVLLTTSTM
jgi:hypothetical protein